MRFCQKLVDSDEKTLDKDVVKAVPQVPMNDVLGDEFVESLGDEDDCEVIDDCLRMPWGRSYA
ncbi:unnamed protein product [Gongylonema pulchrum]|uniref:Uncharacterized protein n=1 Tax=Gongylonema pulchrum TaxID=637853 RepID=A0A183DG07_9BILA|nr:unnamed protein product [Gongylonema pulchrum]